MPRPGEGSRILFLDEVKAIGVFPLDEIKVLYLEEQEVLIPKKAQRVFLA